MILTLEQAETMVERSPRFWRWDGWTLVHSVPNAAGWMKVAGEWRNNKWHVATRIEPSSDGLYNTSKVAKNGIRS